MSAELSLTLATKAFEMMSILEFGLVAEFSFSGEMIAIVILAAMLLVVLVGVAVAAYIRESNRQRTNKEDANREVVRAIQSMKAVMKTVCERVQSRDDVDRDHQAQLLNEIRELRELGTLILDVEKRITGQIEETRRMIRPPRRDGQGHTRIDINGNVNQAGGQIKND